MKEYCSNHPDIKALSLCHFCKVYYCEDCLVEGIDYYYCKENKCQEAKLRETSAHNEVDRSKGTDAPKVMIDGGAVGFCNKCMQTTIKSSISKGFFSHYVLLLNERDACKICGSVIMDLKSQPLIVPFFRLNLGSYRIIKPLDLDPDALYLHRDKYISRKLK
jgi:hypothetical protein